MPMSSQNANMIMAKSNVWIVNINRLLKNVKSDVLANFICVYNKEIVITTNKVVVTLVLNIIEKYIKNVDDINTNEVMSPKLPQSKTYLKILGISHHIKDTNLSLYYIRYHWKGYSDYLYFQWHCFSVLF